MQYSCPDTQQYGMVGRHSGRINGLIRRRPGSTESWFLDRRTPIHSYHYVVQVWIKSIVNRKWLFCHYTKWIKVIIINKHFATLFAREKGKQEICGKEWHNVARWGKLFIYLFHVHYVTFHFHKSDNQKVLCLCFITLTLITRWFVFTIFITKEMLLISDVKHLKSVHCPKV